MLLMLGDRVDVMESRMRRHPFATAAIVAALFAARAQRRKAKARLTPRGLLARVGRLAARVRA